MAEGFYGVENFIVDSEIFGILLEDTTKPKEKGITIRSLEQIDKYGT
jgi:hypothetical protein